MTLTADMQTIANVNPDEISARMERGREPERTGEEEVGTVERRGRMGRVGRTAALVSGGAVGLGAILRAIPWRALGMRMGLVQRPRRRGLKGLAALVGSMIVAGLYRKRGQLRARTRIGRAVEPSSVEGDVRPRIGSAYEQRPPADS